MTAFKFAEKLMTSPWMCDREHLRRYREIYSDYRARIASGGKLDIAEVEQQTGKRLDNTRSVTIIDGVARIPVEGVIMRRANLFTNISGGVSTDVLMRDFVQAYDDPNVHSILFVFDSPGGEAFGIAETAEAIRARRDMGDKRIEAYCDGHCASAAYFLASATSHITTDARAIVGSIGTVMSYPNPAAPGEDLYIDFWNEQSPLKRVDPRNDEGAAAIQGLVDDLGAEFIAAVASNRGVTAEKVMEDFGKGFAMTGRNAVAAGMCDEVGSEQGVIERLREQRATTGPVRATFATAGDRVGGGKVVTSQPGIPVHTLNPRHEEAQIAMDVQQNTVLASGAGEETDERARLGVATRILDFLRIGPSAQAIAEDDNAAVASAGDETNDTAEDGGEPPVDEDADNGGGEKTDKETSNETGQVLDESRKTQERSSVKEDSTVLTSEAAGAHDTDGHDAAAREEVTRLKAELAQERARNARTSATLRERGIERLLAGKSVTTDSEGNRYGMPPPKRRAATSLIAALDDVGVDVVTVSADGNAALADNAAGKALDELLTPWKPQELGERGTVAGIEDDEDDGETPEVAIHALMDKENITYREAAIRLSGRSQEVG